MKTTFLARAGIAVAAGVIALAAYAAVQDLNLKRKPKVGDTGEYKVSATFKTDQGEISFSQKRVDKVTEVKADGGFVLEELVSNTKISFGGQDLPEQPESKSTQELGPDGMLKTVTAEMPIEAATYRIANLHSFKAPDAPAKIGDEIKFEIPADSKRETPKVKTTYKVVATEKVKDWDTIKLTFTSEEPDSDTKSSVKGTIWLSTADASMVKIDETWKDIQPPGAPFPVSGQYTVERVK